MSDAINSLGFVSWGVLGEEGDGGGVEVEPIIIQQTPEEVERHLLSTLLTRASEASGSTSLGTLPGGAALRKQGKNLLARLPKCHRE
jgi:hypothetical protein